MSDLRQYCEGIGLSEDAINILLSHRFDVDRLKLLTDALINEEFREMALGDRLALIDAVRKMKIQDEPNDQRQGASSGAEAMPTVLTRSPPEASARKLIRQELDPTDKQYCMILIGKTGAGKSSTASTIVGDSATFESRCGWTSGTKKCAKEGVLINGTTVYVLDTPGICDPGRDQKAVAEEISRALLLSHPGPHVFLLIVKADDRFTESEFQSYLKLKGIFGEDVRKYTIVVFTRVDQLDMPDPKPGMDKKSQLKKTVKKKIATAPDNLKTILEDVENRYVVFANTADDETKHSQVLELLDLVKRLVSSNTPPRFTNDEVMKNVRRSLKHVECESVDEVPEQIEDFVMRLLIAYVDQLSKISEAARVQENKSYCSVM